LTYLLLLVLSLFPELAKRSKRFIPGPLALSVGSADVQPGRYYVSCVQAHSNTESGEAARPGLKEQTSCYTLIEAFSEIFSVVRGVLPL
jgi:hypothetical protein